MGLTKRDRAEATVCDNCSKALDPKKRIYHVKLNLLTSLRFCDNKCSIEYIEKRSTLRYL